MTRHVITELLILRKRAATRPQQPADTSAIRTEPLPTSELGRNPRRHA
jgi:hypothetical protein